MKKASVPSFLLALAFSAGGFAADGPGVPNIEYAPERVGEILSIINPEKAISATALHRGYLFIPLGADHGGGQGAGAFAFYDVSNPSNPISVFDSRNEEARYHSSETLDYVGDWAEVHHLPVSDDVMLISERRNGSAGFSIFDVSGLYDEDAGTKPRTISRFSFSGVTSPSNYDGYSFALGWQGRRYVYAPTGAQGLYVIDTTDLSNPVQLRHMSRAQLGNVTLRGAWPIGNILILAEGNVQSSFQAKIYDISNPGNPVQIGAFNGPFGYHGFVYGSSFYGGGSPVSRHDFTNPANVVRTDLYPNPDFLNPEYGYGKDGELFIGHYPGATKWKLEGDTAIPAGRVNSGLVDDHAFLNPLGNLVMLCSDHNNDRKLMIGIHGTERDTTPPVATFTSPADGATSQNVLSRVGISFTDFVDPITVNSSTVIVRKFSTGAPVAGTYSSMMGIVNFAPDAPLEENTTYDVLLSAGGVKDQVGNAIRDEIRLARFSTGSLLNDYSTSVAATTPQQVGGTANFTLNVSNSSGLSLEHSWDFGDGSQATPFSSTTTASHTYSIPGNHSVRVRTRIAGQTYAPSVSGVQVIHRAIPAARPVSQSTIVVDPARALVWNVNKDNNSVSAIDTVNHVRVHEIAVGQKPSSLATGPGDTLWVVNKDSAGISVINRASGALAATYPLPAGSAPHGIVIDAAAGFAYVTLEGTGEVAKISNSDGSVVARLNVGPWARGLALDPGRQRLWVSRFISPDEGGQVVPVDLASFTTGPTVPLAVVNNPDSLTNGRGIPNYLAAAVLSPDLTQGFVPSKKDNIFRGLKRDGQPLTFEHAVRSMAASIDLASGMEDPAKRLDFDNSDFATAAAFSPLGNIVFFSTSGSATIWVVDAYNPASTYSFQSDGLSPDGLAVSADGNRLYIHNFMDRSVTVFRTSAACGAVCGTSPRLAKVSTIATEQLPAAVLRGKQIFYDTSDPRLAQEGYMSCASCHLDGGQDGRTWDFTNFGEGFRNTIDLNGRGIGHGPLHWTANFDEVQDFEGQIRDFSQGSGLMAPAVFHRGSRSQPLGESKAGLSDDLDALAAYVESLTEAGRSPHRAADGSLNASAAAGREIFRQEDCASCHGGGAFSDSMSLARHDVGTLGANSGGRLGGEIDGLDTPTLRGLWSSAPYLHDGSAATLRDVLLARNPSGQHGNLLDRSSTEIDQLVSYLLSIDDLELSAPSTAAGNEPQLASQAARNDALGLALSVQLGATGSGALSWEAMGLPPGLSLSSAGMVSGTPLAVGSYTARIAVRDVAGRSSAIAFAWVISDPAAKRYVRLVSLSSHNGGAFSSLADFTLLGRDGKPLERSAWSITASSEEVSQNNAAENAIDPNEASIWHTAWSGRPFPHHLTIDLVIGDAISGFTCLPRQDGSGNGRIKDYQFYVSDDGINWGLPVAAGSFPESTSRQTVLLDSDADGFGDYFEFAMGTNPQDAGSQPPSFYAGLRGWWKLDEDGGTVAVNSAAPADGALVGAPGRVAGIAGGGLEFNGGSQSVQLPSPGITSNTVTISAWVKRNGSQASWAGVAFSRSGTASGFGFGSSSQLRYHWNDNYYNFSSGLSVPNDTWTFCALVVEPGKATLYMKPTGGPMQTAVNNASHAAASLNGDWYLGQDPTGGRFFKGQLDDARIYGRSLSAAEISLVAAAENRAPVFASVPLGAGNGVAGVIYAGSIAGSASDPDAGDSLAYAKVGGPAWLAVAADGTLSGTPSAGDIGMNVFTVRVSDVVGASAHAALQIVVIDPSLPAEGSYERWLLDNNLPSNGSGEGAPGANPSGDGISNEMKHALGLPVDSQGYAGRISARLEQFGGQFFNTLTYVRPDPAPPGTAYDVEASANLQLWSGDGMIEVSSTAENGLRTTTVRDAVPAGDDAPKRFIRLKVTR